MKFTISVSCLRVTDRKLVLQTLIRFFDKSFLNFDKACNFALAEGYECFDNKSEVVFREWKTIELKNKEKRVCKLIQKKGNKSSTVVVSVEKEKTKMIEM